MSDKAYLNRPFFEPAHRAPAKRLEEWASHDVLPLHDHYLVDGVKTWISSGGIADFYTVVARTGEAPGAKGLGCAAMRSSSGCIERSARCASTRARAKCRN